eukprot:CAMPEP_0177226384 /NCGR_PEP_ID=MMETSP0367-20130122/40054_1 /TAXON_ID=447022 ORGANISM="Scrippsiella hangoei-like, Strain SHHI-4" /NCGR_SAMPLE_ID=MMETSP0367 /ASSEMBLY_ACC=CAM_ASM_000362 /LENGTH=128 /DNA_ID=CAMNT_0018676547 /DNA_START=243 /DNA_END=629 /DNA_ORIENTATION=-
MTGAAVFFMPDSSTPSLACCSAVYTPMVCVPMFLAPAGFSISPRVHSLPIAPHIWRAPVETTAAAGEKEDAPHILGAPVETTAAAGAAALLLPDSSTPNLACCSPVYTPMVKVPMFLVAAGGSIWPRV